MLHEELAEFLHALQEFKQLAGCDQRNSTPHGRADRRRGGC
jgi:hypothetical protein